MARTPIFFSRPKDESLEAFKAWINETTLKLNPNAKDYVTEEEWRKKWQQFWGKSEDDEQKTSCSGRSWGKEIKAVIGDQGLGLR